MRKLFVIAIAIFSFLTACTKIESTDIGSGLIPAIDRVNTFDTLLTVVTANYTEENENFFPRVYKTNDQVIGVINTDPLFGKTTASAFFELKPTTYPFSFSGTKLDLKVDSVVLVLSYKGMFGDSTISQNWEVREMVDILRSDSAYQVNTNISKGNLLGSKNIDLKLLDDSVNYGFENAANQIRIPLQNSFAQRIIKFDSSKEFLNDSAFRTNFRGFAVSSTGSGNALVRVNLADTNTKLAIYYNYKIPDSARRSSVVSYFRFSDGSIYTASATANAVTRNRTGSQAASYTNNPAKTDEVFIQTSPGIFATVKIPGLRGFPNVIIHRAELIAEQDPDLTSAFDTTFPAPRYLLLSAYDSVNKRKTNIPNDFIYDASNGPNIETFGGLLTNKTIAPYGVVSAYSFNMTRYVQGIVTRKDSSYTLRLSAPVNDSLLYTNPYPTTGSTTLYISPSQANNVAIGRVRLGGGNNPRVRMRLRIIYSKI